MPGKPGLHYDQNKLPCPSSSDAAATGLRGLGFFAGFGSSASRSSAVIGRISCASSLATRLTRVETSCQANSPSSGARQQRHHLFRIVVRGNRASVRNQPGAIVTGTR